MLPPAGAEEEPLLSREGTWRMEGVATLASVGAVTTAPGGVVVAGAPETAATAMAAWQVESALEAFKCRISLQR